MFNTIIKTQNVSNFAAVNSKIVENRTYETTDTNRD